MDSMDNGAEQSERSLRKDAVDPSLDHLRFSTLFEPLGADVYRSVMNRLTRRTYKEQEVILQEEGSGQELFFLVEGRVKIVHCTKSGAELMINLLHPGDFFGEMELIDGRSRTSRVVAEDDCVVYCLEKAGFAELSEANQAFALRLMQVLSIRLRSLKQTFIAELERNEQRQKKEETKLNLIIDAAQIVNSTLELHELVDVILETSLRLLDADRGTVYIMDEKQNELWSLIYKGPEQIKIKLHPGQGIAGYVGAIGDTVNIPDAYLDHRFNPEVDRLSGYRTKTILCLPMKNREGKIIGVFQLLNKHTGAFTTEDEQLLSAFSIHAAIAVENARLYAQERERVAMEKDLLAAQEVQKTLLPRRIPKVSGFQFAASSIPAKNVGGDLYDFITIDEKRIAFCLGDVTGKGLPASLLMANAQATLRSNTYSDITPRQCIERSNVLLYNTTAPDKFVTLFYGVIDTRDGSLTYTNAGQEHPMLIGRDGSVKRLSAGGIPLGLLGSAPYNEERIVPDVGDVIVLFSDGITEAANASNELWGEEALASVIEGSRLEEPQVILERILDAVRLHAGAAPQWDDMTLMVIKCTA